MDKWVMLRTRQRMPRRCARPCSPRVQGTSVTTRTAAGVSPVPDSSCRRTAHRPTIGARRIRGTCRRGSRRGRRAGPAARAMLAAMRAAHPYEEPAFDVFALAPVARRRRAGPDRHSGRRRRRLAEFVARVHAALPRTSWGMRAAGEDDTEVSRVAVCGGAGDSLLDIVAARRSRRLRHRRPAAPSRRRAPPTLRRRADRRRTLGQRVSLVQSGGRAAPRPLRRLAAGAGVRASAPIHGTSREMTYES